MNFRGVIMDKEKKVLVMGVIGADVHAVGNKILYHAFTEAGFECVNLGVWCETNQCAESKSVTFTAGC